MMMKGAFIPKKFRPNVPGSKLQYSSHNLDGIKFSNKDSIKTTEECILLISAKEDIVPDYFLRDINKVGAVVHLYYDELGTLWDFSFSENILKIYLKEKILIPSSIYHRHPGVFLEHPNYQKHTAFFEVLDIWKGNLIGQKRDHYQNFSKGFQGITSIKIASLENKEKVKYPKSFFLKGDYQVLINRFKQSLIVKSCSNMRSKVVSEDVYSEWNFEKLNYLPTFFQEKIIGNDIRVHVCGNVVWPLQVESKDCVDYRYASKGSVVYSYIELPYHIKNFCKSLAYVERNIFIGVDLMKSNNKYYCLESNPGPGWSTYHHPSKKVFAKKVFKQLLRK